MNLPNKLTISRIVLALIFIQSLCYTGLIPKIISLLVFALAAVTDYYDGKIARETNQITPFGRLMDPIADKILTFSAFFGFVQLGIIPAWMAVLIVTRELLITGIRLTMPPNSERVGALRSGKHKTVVQIVSIVSILIFLVLRESSLWNPSWNEKAMNGIFFAMIFVVGITLWSGVRYLYVNREYLTGGTIKS